MSVVNFARRIGLGMVARGWSQVTSLCLSMLAARILGKQDFGVFAVANVFIILLQGLMYGGVYDYIIKNQSKLLETNTCFWMSLGFGVAGAAFISAVAPLMGMATHTPLTMTLMLALAPAPIIASVTSWQEALLLRKGRLTVYYIIFMVTESCACLVALGVVIFGAGIWTFVIYRYFQLFLSGVAIFCAVRQVPKFEWHSPLARKVWDFAGNIYVTNIVGTASNYGADLLIGMLVSPAAAGAYRLASRMVSGLSDIAYIPISTLAWVQFSRAGPNAARLAREWLGLLTALTIIMWPALAGLALVSKPAIQILVGPGWDDAAPVIIVLAAARMLASFGLFLAPMQGVFDRTRVTMNLGIAAAAISICMLCILAPFGAASASIAQLISVVFTSICGITVCLRATQLSAKELIYALYLGILGTIAVICGVIITDFLHWPYKSPINQIIYSIFGAGICWFIAMSHIFFKKRLRT